MANDTKLFFGVIMIGVTSVKIIGNYAHSGINYALKSFIILVPVGTNDIKLFIGIIYKCLRQVLVLQAILSIFV